MRHILYFGLAILLSSCATTTTNYYSASVQSWRGAPIADLVERWGRADMQFPDQKGNTLYLYKIQTYRSNSTQPVAPQVGVNVAGGRPIIITTPNTNFSASRDDIVILSCLTTFVVNPKGEITGVQTEGNACQNNAKFANRANQSNIQLTR